MEKEMKRKLKAELETVELGHCVLKDVTGGYRPLPVGDDSILLDLNVQTNCSVYAGGKNDSLIIRGNNNSLVAVDFPQLR